MKEIVRSRMKAGVFIEGAPWDRSLIADYIGKSGTTPSIVMWFQAWGGAASRFDAALFRTVLDMGSIPMLTWEPWNPAIPDDPNFTLSQIATGRWDNYVREWAVGMRDLKQTVYLRFAHEMNGNWYPWSAENGGGAMYVSAYRRVNEIFRTSGAGNVKWVWSPNVEYGGSYSLIACYPLDDVVDYIGIDGYNWGGDQWIDPAPLFMPTYEAIRTFTQKPVFIAETACADHPQKPRWIRGLARLKPFDHAVWFNADKERDWRFDSSPQSEKAFRAFATKGSGE